MVRIPPVLWPSEFWHFLRQYLGKDLPTKDSGKSIPARPTRRMI